MFPALRIWFLALFLAIPLILAAETSLPPAPGKFVKDEAGLLSPAAVSTLNAKLAENERQTTNQIVVAIFKELPPGENLEDYANRTFRAWGVGQKEKNNGIVLFIFRDSRKMRLEVGYGLEGVLPDATAKQILSTILQPAFRGGDFDGGVSRAVDAILAATRGEYSAPVKTFEEREAEEHKDDIIPLLLIIVFGIVLLSMAASAIRKRRGTYYGPQGRRDVWLPYDWGSNSSSSSWDSSSSSSDSGGFSGGGGDSGGGGASGSW